jgi:hypothetical protein
VNNRPISNRPAQKPDHFDIEIKTADLLLPVTVVVDERREGELQAVEGYAECLNVSDLYRDVATADCAEAECAAGYTLLQAMKRLSVSTCFAFQAGPLSPTIEPKILRSCCL